MAFVTQVLQVDETAGVPAVLADGMFWYNNVANTHQARQNGATVDVPGSASPWAENAGVLYPITFATDVVVIGSNAMSGGDEHLYVFDDTEDDASVGVLTHLQKNGANAKVSWYGFHADVAHTGADNGTMYVGHMSTQTLNNAAATIVDAIGFASEFTLTDGSITRANAYLANINVGASKTVDEYIGVKVDGSVGTGIITNAKGVEVNDVGLTNSLTAYGVHILTQSGTTAWGLLDENLAQVKGLVMPEQAATPWTPAADFGAFWIKNDTPSTAWFTDDGGTDHQLGVTSPWSENAGVLYPTTHATDDVAIGTNAMSGTERLRVSGDVLIDTNGQLGINTAPVATAGISILDNYNAADTQGISVVLTKNGGAVGDDFKGYTADFNITSDAGNIFGLHADIDLVGAEVDYVEGVYVDIDLASTSNITAAAALFRGGITTTAADSILQAYGLRATISATAAGEIADAWGVHIASVDGDDSATGALFSGIVAYDTAGVASGIYIDGITGGAGGGVAYGVYIGALAGTTQYGIFQADTSATNAFYSPIVVGTSSVTTSAGVEVNSTTMALLVSRMTTTQRNALTAANGMIIYNTTETQFEFYEDDAWVSGSGLK